MPEQGEPTEEIKDAGHKVTYSKAIKPRGRAIVEGGPGTAARATAVLGAILAFAVSRDLRPDNPARGVKLNKGRKVERFLSAAELARPGDALAAVERQGVNPYAIAAIRLLLLTGCRRNEILGLRWKWVDFERAALRLPDSKSGAKSVPLGAPAPRNPGHSPARGRLALGVPRRQGGWPPSRLAARLAPNCEGRGPGGRAHSRLAPWLCQCRGGRWIEPLHPRKGAGSHSGPHDREVRPFGCRPDPGRCRSDSPQDRLGDEGRARWHRGSDCRRAK